MVSLIILILIGIVFFWSLIAKSVYDSVTQMNRIERLTLTKDEPPEDDTNRWAVENKFYYLGEFLLQAGNARTLVAVWRHYHDPTFFSACFAQGLQPHASNESKVLTQELAFDFTTCLENDYSLTTGSTASANLFPSKQGSYKQTFTISDLEELFRRHQEGVGYLKTVGGARFCTLNKPVEQYILDALHSSTDYVRSLFLWPLRGAYWYFIRRKLWHGLSIQQQHEKRMIKLPNEIRVFQLQP